VTQAIELRIPNERPFHGVARLVVGGLAARHNLSYEALEDLQLALVTVLEGDAYSTAAEIRVELEVTDEAIAMAIGPLNGEAVRADLEQSSDGDLGLGRLLGTLVEDAEVEAREDGDWLRLSKRVRGIKPAGTNA
jgi:anti-sigma regulatory factor (Ser/Thr protein kinase)